MDAILVDLLNPWLATYNQEKGANLKIEDLWCFDPSKCVSPEDPSIYEIIERPGWFRNLKPLPGALEAVEKLVLNNECFIVSTPSAASCSYMDKIDWLAEHLPKFDRNHILLTGAKYLIEGDVLIDDSPKNANEYRKHHPKAKIVGIKYPYNSHNENYDLLANNWKYPECAWDSILDYLL